MTKRLPENLRGAAHRRRSVRNVRPSTSRAGNPDDPGRELTDEAPRRPITLPRVRFLERLDPNRAGEPRRDIKDSTDSSTDSSAKEGREMGSRRPLSAK
jgi:hypothetical protein